MRWPDLLLAVGDIARNDAVLSNIYGEAIRLGGSKAHAVPSLDLHLISDVETELWEPAVLQWSQYAPSLDALIESERRLRALFVHPLAVSLGDLTVFCEFVDGVALDSPTRDNVNARAIRIRFEPLRSGLIRPDLPPPPVYETIERLEDSLVATAGNYYGWGGNNAGRLKIGWDVQTLGGDIGDLHKIVAFLRGGTPTPPVGDVRAQLCALVGNHETDAIPGAVLATSDPVDASAFNTSIQPVPQRVEFTFTGAERIALSPETRYMIVLDGTDVTNVGLVADTGANEFWSRHNWNGSVWSRSFFRYFAFELWSAETQVVVP